MTNRPLIKKKLNATLDSSSFLRVVSIIMLVMFLCCEAHAQLPRLGNERKLDEAVALSKSDVKKSEALAKEIVERSSSPYIKAQALNLLGSMEKKRKQYGLAEKYYFDAYIYSKDAKQIEISAESLRHLADVHRFTDRLDQALDFAQQAIMLAGENGLHRKMALAYNVEGNIYKMRKRYKESLQSYQSALTLIEQHNFEDLKSRGFSNVGEMNAKLGLLAEALKYRSMALKTEENAENPRRKEIVKYLDALSTYSRKMGDYRTALQYGLRGLAIVNGLDSTNLKQRILLNLTIIYRKLAEYDTALKYATELRKSYLASGNLEKEISTSIQIALIYEHTKDYRSADEFYENVLNIPPEKISTKYQASINRGKASILCKMGECQRALGFAEKAKGLFAKAKDKAGLEAVNRLLGRIYTEIGNAEAAQAAHEEALRQARDLGSSWAEANNLIHLGVLFIEEDTDKAKRLMDSGVAIARKMETKSMIVNGYKAKMALAEKMGDYKTAYEMSVKSKHLSGELYKEDIARRIANLKIVNEISEKEKKIEILEQQEKIAELELSTKASNIDLLNRKNTINHLKIEKKRFMRHILFGSALIVLIFFAFLYTRLWQKKTR